MYYNFVEVTHYNRRLNWSLVGSTDNITAHGYT